MRRASAVQELHPNGRRPYDPNADKMHRDVTAAQKIHVARDPDAPASGRIELIEQQLVIASPRQPTPYEFEGLLPRRGAPALMIGDPGTFKSTIAIAMCDWSVTGEPAFGRFPTTRRPGAIYLECDSDRESFADQMRLIGRSVPGIRFASLAEVNAAAVDATLSDPANRGSFVVKDPLAAFYVPDMRSDQGADVRRFLRSERALFEENDLGGLIIDHTNRMGRTPRESFSGSQQKLATARTMLHVQQLASKDRNRGRFRMSCVKPNGVAPFESFLGEIEWSETTCRVFYAGDDQRRERSSSDPSSDVDLVTAALTRAGGAGLMRSEIEEIARLTRRRAAEALKQIDCETIGKPNAWNRRYVLRSAEIGDAEVNE